MSYNYNGYEYERSQRTRQHDENVLSSSDARLGYDAVDGSKKLPYLNTDYDNIERNGSGNRYESTNNYNTNRCENTAIYPDRNRSESTLYQSRNHYEEAHQSRNRYEDIQHSRNHYEDMQHSRNHYEDRHQSRNKHYGGNYQNQNQYDEDNNIRHNRNYYEDDTNHSISQDTNRLAASERLNNSKRFTSSSSSSRNNRSSRKKFYENEDILGEKEVVTVRTLVKPLKTSIIVEIMPGLEVTLRSADETREAIRKHFYNPTLCYGCFKEFFCIADAKYHICPQCKVVSPLENDCIPNSKRHGVGMGFTVESLAS